MNWKYTVLAVLLALASPLGTRAQAGGLQVPARPLASLSLADTSFAELEFLRTEIGGARVVMLGEPTHGEGNVLAAKARLVAFLQQRLGFTTLAMESGFFSVHKAQQAIAAGKSVKKNVQASVFPIWTQTQEFQPVLPLLGAEGGLRLMGFDSQLSGDYDEDLTDDLEDFLEPEKAAATINYDLLDEVAGYMGEHFAWPPGHPLADYEAELNKAQALLQRAAAAPGATRRADAAFWQQCLRSLAAQARDYAQRPALVPQQETFTAADSNPRDAQMADNLLWYLRQHPAEKIICWGALPHFANHAEALENDELRDYRPMGRAVKAALGDGQVYILGTLAGGGHHGLVGQPALPVPVPAPGTLEASLLAGVASPLAFVSLKHDAVGRQLTTYAFEYQPVAGPWSEVVDGFLFFKSVEPPHLLMADSTARLDSAALAASPAPGMPIAAPGPVGAVLRRPVGVANVSGVRTVRGVVLDGRSRKPVPYAAVQLPGQGAGTLADGQGRFALPLPGPTLLQVVSLGYEQANVRSPAGTEELTVLLTPAAYALDEVRVAAQPVLSPEAILKKIVQRIPANYEQQDYAAEVYTHRRLSNFDTLRLEVETVSRFRVPAGFRHFTRGFMGHEDGTYQLVEQRHVLAQQGQPISQFNGVERYGDPQGYLLAAADPVRTAPLFKRGGARHYQLKLDSLRHQGQDTLYVLSFAARHANHRSTGTYLTGLYQGRLLVRRRDFAVLRYEALWGVDTAYVNTVARQHYRRPPSGPNFYTSLFSADRTTHVVDYVKMPNGRYYVRRSVGRTASTGRTLGRGAFSTQSFTENYFTLLPSAGPPPPPPPRPGETRPPLPPYRSEFWESYQRPQ